MAPAAPPVPSAPSPVQPHLGTGAALQGQGEPSASPGSHTAHTPPCPGGTEATLPNSVVIASYKQPQGSYANWINHIKAGLCKKSNLFPLIVKLVTM